MESPDFYFADYGELNAGLQIKKCWFNGFIGFFETNFDPQILIDYFHFCEESGIVNFRGKQANGYSFGNTIKDSSVMAGFLPDYMRRPAQSKSPASHTEAIRYASAQKSLRAYVDLIHMCLGVYEDKFEPVSDMNLVPIFISVQRTRPTEGYHVFHDELGVAGMFAKRRLVTTVYLNDVDEGGETEFLYQSLKVKPKKGTVLIWPADWTHTHRGNPPLKGDKYIATSWMEIPE